MVDVGRRRRARGASTSSSSTSSFSTPKKKVDPLVASQTALLRALKRRVDLGACGADDLVDEAMLQLSRPGGPRLNADDRGRVRATLQTLAKNLTPPSARALYGFCKDAAQVAWQLHHHGRSPGATLRERSDVHSLDDVRALAQAAVYKEWLHARGDDDLVRRAVTRALGERRRGAPGRLVPLADDDPVRDLLNLPPAGRVRLPRGDIRGAIAKATTTDAHLGGLLRQVAVFSRPSMEAALGEELWILCRPVGFADPRHKKILVVTASSVAAQEAQLRSRELLYRLQKVPALSHITGIRVIVDRVAFLG